MKKIQSIKHTLKVAGFTVIELIVVIAIIALVSTLVLFNNTKLNSALLLSNTAYEVGLIVREAQAAGLGVRATADSGTQNFNFSQGVHFDIDTPNTVILFSDIDGNGRYNGSNEDIQLYTIANSRAGKILNICGVVEDVGQSTCTDTTKLDITFKRPNPEALIQVGVVSTGDGSTSMSDFNNTVVVNIGFEGDICRSIIIQKTGAVEVDTRYCPQTPAN